MPMIAASSLPTGNLKGADPRGDDLADPRPQRAGSGAAAARHPYDETWVVIDGTSHLPGWRGTPRGRAGRHRDRPAERAAQVHQRRPRTLQSGLHPRQPDLRHRVAGMSPLSADQTSLLASQPSRRTLTKQVAWLLSDNGSHAGRMSSRRPLERCRRRWTISSIACRSRRPAADPCDSERRRRPVVGDRRAGRQLLGARLILQRAVEEQFDR